MTYVARLLRDFDRLTRQTGLAGDIQWYVDYANNKDKAVREEMERVNLSTGQSRENRYGRFRRAHRQQRASERTVRRLDLLNEPPPAEWLTTRRCPTCSSPVLRTESDEVELGRWCSTYCGNCGRKLRVDRIDAPPWEDPEWAKAGEQ